MSKIIGKHVKPSQIDPTQFTSVIIGSTTNPTKGTVSYDKAFWWREGKFMNIKWDYLHTAAGGAGSGTYYLQMPVGYTIDTSYYGTVGSVGGGYPICGEFSIAQTSNQGTGVAIVVSSTLIGAYHDVDANSSAVAWTAANDPFNLTTVLLSMVIKVPIVGWLANDILRTSDNSKV